ncbi:MAG: hypothetical protein ACLTSX_02655 [Collinsella sp.]
MTRNFESFSEHLERVSEGKITVLQQVVSVELAKADGGERERPRISSEPHDKSQDTMRSQAVARMTSFFCSWHQQVEKYRRAGHSG